MENIKKTVENELIAEGGMTLGALADAFQVLQGGKNNGKGLSCVEEIIKLLRQGDVGRARRVATHDADKIHDSLGQNRDVEHLVKTELFRGESEHPWSFLERLQSESEED